MIIKCLIYENLNLHIVRFDKQILEILIGRCVDLHNIWGANFRDKVECVDGSLDTESGESSNVYDVNDTRDIGKLVETSL